VNLHEFVTSFRQKQQLQTNRERTMKKLKDLYVSMMTPSLLDDKNRELEKLLNNTWKNNNFIPTNNNDSIINSLWIESSNGTISFGKFYAWLFLLLFSFSFFLS
jgi:hypothetical protein